MKKKVLIDLSGNTNVVNFQDDEFKGFILQHEFGKWMVEVVHKKPFTYKNTPFLENNITDCFKFLEKECGQESILGISPYLLLGVDVYYKNYEIDLTSMDEDIQKMQADIEQNPFSQSQFTNDIIVNPHPRFGTLAKNNRKRRGSKVCIKIPIFIDEKTDLGEKNDEPFPGYIYMDSMAFGMGGCCFKITLGSSSLKNYTYMYDQMLPFTALLVRLCVKDTFNC